MSTHNDWLQIQSVLLEEFVMYADLWAMLILITISYMGLIGFWIYLNFLGLSFDEYVMRKLIRDSSIPGGIYANLVDLYVFKGYANICMPMSQYEIHRYVNVYFQPQIL